MKIRLFSLMILFLALLLIGYLKPKNEEYRVIGERKISLSSRQPDPWVNEVFKDNILLNLAYLRKKITNPHNIAWENVREPFTYRLALKPNQTFAFHDDVLSGVDNVVATSGAHFNYQDGFKSDGYLVGDGVCHLASLMYWVSKDAGLDVKAPTNHNFMAIPEIPKEYGVSIYYMPGQKNANAVQNLYVKNTREKTVEFVFEYQQETLNLSIVELN